MTDSTIREAEKIDTRNVALKPLDANAACPKCDHRGVTMFYHADDCLDKWNYQTPCHHLSRPSGDHFRRTCTRCHFCWIEGPQPRCREAEGEPQGLEFVRNITQEFFGSSKSCLVERDEAEKGFHETYRAGFRAGRSQPIDGFYRDGVHRKDCPCAECKPAVSKPVLDQVSAFTADGKCRKCGSTVDPACPDCDTPNADRKEQMTEASYMANRKALIDAIIVDRGSDPKKHADVNYENTSWGCIGVGESETVKSLKNQIDALDQRYQSQKKEPTVKESLTVQPRCDECGKPFTSMLGERSCLECCRKTPNPFDKPKPPPASDEAKHTCGRIPCCNKCVATGQALGWALDRERVRRASDAALKNVKPDMHYYAETTIDDFVEQLKRGGE